MIVSSTEALTPGISLSHSPKPAVVSCRTGDPDAVKLHVTGLEMGTWIENVELLPG